MTSTFFLFFEKPGKGKVEVALSVLHRYLRISNIRKGKLKIKLFINGKLVLL